MLGAVPGLCAGLLAILVLSLVTKVTGEPVPPRRRPVTRDDDPGFGPPVPLVSVEMGKRTATVTIPRGHALPMVCVACGDPGTREWEQTFSWTPAWSVPLLIAGLHYSRSVTLPLPVCGCRGRWHWRAAKVFAAGVAVATAVGAVGYYGVSATDLDLGTNVIVGAVLFGMLSGVGALMLTADPISLGHAEVVGVTLDGVSHNFAHALTPGGGPRTRAPAGGTELVTARCFRP